MPVPVPVPLTVPVPDFLKRFRKSGAGFASFQRLDSLFSIIASIHCIDSLLRLIASVRCFDSLLRFMAGSFRGFFCKLPLPNLKWKSALICLRKRLTKMKTMLLALMVAPDVFAVAFAPAGALV